MSNQLEVGIGANIDNLKKGLSEAEKALNSFAKETKAITDKLQNNAIETSKVRKEITSLKTAYASGKISQNDYGRGMLDLVNKEKNLSNETKTLRANLSTLNKSTNDLGGKGMNTLKKGTISGNSAMTAFSRTVQDAPFGIMGVSNNITNLTEQFGYLKNKTGSAKGALQAMLRDLKGFGGISLAISIVTSALVIFGDELFKSKDKAKSLRDEQDKLTKSLEDYEFTLKGVQKTELEGAKSATKELVTLKLLKSQLEDTSLSNKKRLDAFIELQKRYPSYLSQISNEVALNKGLGNSYKTLKKLVEDKAKADAAAKNIVENTKKELVLTSQLEAENIKSAKLKLSLANAEALALKRAGKERSGSNLSVERALELKKKVNKQTNIEQGIIDKITKLQADSLVLANQIKTVGGVVPLDFKVSDKAALSRDKVVSIFESSGVKEAAGEIAGSVSENFNNGLNLEGGVNWQKLFKLQQFQEQSLMMQNLLINLSESMNNLVLGTFTSALSGIGNALGNALATGGNVLSAVGTSLIQGLAGFLGKMGELLIEYGALAVAKGKIDIAIATGGPVAIAAGFAAIAVGVALKAASALIGSAASGGFSSGGSSSGVSGGGSYSGGSTRTAPSVSSGFGGGTVVFEIAGNKLVGVLNNTLQRNKGLGGNLSLG